jgi:YD repeat-containing protein
MAPDISPTYTIANTPINLQVANTVNATLTNGDPLSPSEITTTTMLQNDPTRIFTSDYVSSSRTLTTTSPVGRKVVETFGAKGQINDFRVAGIQKFDFTYDANGRLTSLVQDARNLNFSYDSYGRVASITDSLGRVTMYSYDLSNRVTSETLPDGSVIGFTYDKNGNLTSLTPPLMPAHSFEYNAMNLLDEYVPPSVISELNGNTTYQYNLDQQLSGITRPDGSQISLSYSPNGTLNSIATPEGNYAFGYAPNSSLVVSAESPDAVTTN